MAWRILGVRPDPVVEIRDDILREKDGPMLVHGLQGFQASQILIPTRRDLQPDRDFLAERYEDLQEGGVTEIAMLGTSVRLGRRTGRASRRKNMVHVDRIGKGRKTAFRAGLGLALLVGVCGWVRAGEERGRTGFVGSRAGDAYVLARGAAHGTSASVSVDEFVELQKKFSGDFLWVRRGAKKFLIRDRAVLEQAQSFFEPLRALEPDLEALHVKQRELEREESALDREQEGIERKAEDLEDDHGDKADAIRAEARRQEDALKPRMNRVEARQRELDRVERSLDEREEVLEKNAEERLWVLVDATLARGLAERLNAR